MSTTPRLRELRIVYGLSLAAMALEVLAVQPETLRRLESGELPLSECAPGVAEWLERKIRAALGADANIADQYSA